MKCALCKNITEKNLNALNKTFYLCDNCHLIFMDQKHRLNSLEESKRYSYHQNNIDNKGYVKFLEKVINPSMEYINTSMTGLDFGCGPTPVLSNIIENKGINCDYYDPYFYNSLDLGKKYDFIFATECFEHFYNPSDVISLISILLKQNAILSIMTEFYGNIEQFPQWYYIKDPTHVSFYNENVFSFICKTYGFKKIFSDNQRVIILKKI